MLTLIREGEKIPPRSLIVGNPGKIIKEVSDEMIKWKTEGTKLYQSLPGEMKGLTDNKASDYKPLKS